MSRIGRQRRILVVEDDEMVRDAVAMMLRTDDHEVVTASTAAEALGLLERGSYDVIVSDLRIPYMDGPTFYREVKQRWPAALPRLIFMTGSAEDPESARFLRETGVPVLAKPFTPESLRQAVQRAFGAP
ncbi:MAG: histidine kinase, two-component system, NtrC family, sensor kinase [Candidatus Rokubacteria bacterium CSP1-6]|nr:MAG: histidine kinase, two-component system, NtrC family, sensor kinase [Candidatus Rokubacteria bacterium CSP1-6]